MLNRVVIMGRMTADPEVRCTQSGTAVTRFTVAVDDDYKDANGNKATNFIDCVAWRQTAEFVGKYFAKGKLIIIEGKLTTRPYEDKDGKKRKAQEVRVDAVSFAGDRNDAQPKGTDKTPTADDLGDFELILDDNGVPF